MKLIMPSQIKGEVNAPPSKSMMNRAIAASLLVEGITTILHPSFCDDSIAAMGIAEALGVTIEKSTKKVKVSSPGIFRACPRSTTLDCRESGLCMRMFAPIAALRSEEFTLSAEGTLLKRDMRMVCAISQLGAHAQTHNGKPPLRIKGPMRGGTINIDGSQSSQFLTGLLMALPLCKEDSVINVTNLKSKPYVEMTLSLLKEFGIEIMNKDFQQFMIKGGQQYRKGIVYTVEGDWSGAAFLLVGGAIAGKVVVRNLRVDSPQGDKAILDALRAAGAKVSVMGDGVSVEKAELKAFEFDATDYPDLFPPLVVFAANCEGITIIHGAKRLKNKESNRALALMKEFSGLGIEIRVEGDVMRIKGGKIKSGKVDSRNDHRIAMAAAIAGLNASGPIRITNPECVSKSYPNFFKDLEGLMK